jgi:hypothetical protein
MATITQQPSSKATVSAALIARIIEADPDRTISFLQYPLLTVRYLQKHGKPKTVSVVVARRCRHRHAAVVASSAGAIKAATLVAGEKRRGLNSTKTSGSSLAGARLRVIFPASFGMATPSMKRPAFKSVKNLEQEPIFLTLQIPPRLRPLLVGRRRPVISDGLGVGGDAVRFSRTTKVERISSTRWITPVSRSACLNTYHRQTNLGVRGMCNQLAFLACHLGQI